MFSKLLVFFKIKKPKLEPYFGRITQMPYVVNVENTTDKPIENVSLFFGNSQNELAFNSKGSYVENGLTISSGVPNVTYNHIVKNSITNKINVGLTYVQSTNTRQVLEKLSIKTQNANGTSAVKVLTPQIDPYQQQTHIVAVKQNYTLDGDTEVIIHKVEPRTFLKMYFYPSINEKSKFFDKLTK